MAQQASGMQKIGAYAFLFGIIIAILAGIWAGVAGATALGSTAIWVSVVLVILGLIVGLLNVTDKETVPFIVAAIGLSLGSQVNWNLAVGQTIAGYATPILLNIGVFVVPAALIVSLKAIWSLAANQ